MTDQRHPTQEVCHLSSDGIQDHYHKFWENARSFLVYDWMLKNAKKLGPDRGVIYFTTTELDHAMSHERSSDKESFRGRSAVIRLIDFLESIEMIKILQRPNRKGTSWRVKMLKYKCDDQDFPMLVNVTKNESSVAPQLQKPASVAPQLQKADEDTEEAEICVAPVLQNPPEAKFDITPLDTGQLELWSMENRSQASAKSPELLSHDSYKPRHGWVKSNPCYEWMLDVPGPNVGLFCVALKSAWVEVAISNSYILTLSESLNNSSTFEEQLLRQIKAGATKNKSSEEIIDPDRAIALCDKLHKISADSPNKKTRKAAQKARDEFFMLYWNGLCTDEKRNFNQCVSLETRRKKLETRFSGPLFRSSWAKAFVRIKNSPHCNARTDRKWKASFDWVIRSDDAVTRAIEGMYDGRERKKAGQKQRGRIQRSFGGGSYLKGLPITQVEPGKENEWAEENPESAREAKESGLWGMRFGDDNRAKA